MVTFNYNFTYILLLVLQASVSLCQENSTVTPVPPLTSISDSSTTPAPSEFPETPINGTKIIPYNATVDNLFNLKEDANNTANLNDTQTVKTTKVDNGTQNATAGNTVESVNTTGLINDSSSKVHVDLTNSSNKIDTEVPGLLENPNIQRYEIPATPPNVTLNATIDRETELIEDGQNTEDILRNSSSCQDDSHVPGVPLIQGHLAVILAAVFVTISIVAYVGLLSWRRFLENRYGNREMLVDEDELDRDDLRYFSL